MTARRDGPAGAWRAWLYASVADLEGSRARPADLGCSDVLIFAAPELFWSPATTRAQVAQEAARLRAAAPATGLHVAHWCFAPGDALNPWAASEAAWQVYLERLRWWSDACARHHFLGVSMDAEHYPSTPGMSGGGMSPKTAWLDSPGFAARGEQYVAALRSAAPRLALGNFVSWWTVRQGAGIDCRERDAQGRCKRNPLPGYFTFWNAVYAAAGGGFYFDEETYQWRDGSDLPEQQEDVAVSLPRAKWVPGVWLKPQTALAIIPEARRLAGAVWVYQQGALRDAALRERLAAALRPAG